MFWRSSTFMYTIFLALFLGFWLLWTLGWLLGLNSLMSFICTECCSRRAAQEDEKAIEWSMAEAHINRLHPPASYRLEDNPDFKYIKQYIVEDDASASFRKSGGFFTEEEKERMWQQQQQHEQPVFDVPGMVPAPMPDCEAPVPMMSARCFLGALKAEYLNGYQGEVEKYFSTGGLPADDQKVLAEYEDTVRKAENKEKRIEEIAAQWGLHVAGQGNFLVEDDMQVESHHGGSGESHQGESHHGETHQGETHHGGSHQGESH
eukprot:CAMPEP_0172915972 /NCGR_PEP_ID=MMETSP1075-20121228/195314_1 /TAXON_ID=2916 /ORGANISM="Ceratium fusus, Strain PA161109" /LENGTH=261 /DNA_ID=CAMNT_0013775145 /DNA_START=146 /DNA_END=928 /DNA_ORIENTATION=-